MIEKTDVGVALMSASIVAASPALGDYAIILVVSVFGALGALSLREQMTRRDALWFVFRAVSIAAVMSSAGAVMLARLTGVDVPVLLAPVAFVLAWIADRWPELAAAATTRIIDWMRPRS